MRELEQLGDSVLVVGDSTTLKVHVHTDDPNAATALFAGAGAVSHLDVADMREQVQQRDERLDRLLDRASAARWRSSPATGCARCSRASASGSLDGGPTLNPSTYDLLAAIHAIRAEEVVVLPNSPNVVMAAERAAELSDKTVRVVPSRSLQAGLAAAVSLDPRAAPRQRGGDGRDACSGCGPARWRRRPATTLRAASARGTRSASSRRRSSRGAGRARRCAACSSSWPRTPS